MATQVKMPQPGNSVEECLLVRWLKIAGEKVAQGEAIAEIESDKSTFEIESPESGVLLAAFFREGEVVPVHTPICTVGQPSELSKTKPVDNAVTSPPTKPPALTESTADASVGTSGVPRVTFAQGALPDAVRDSNPGAPVSPRAARYAAQHGVPLAKIHGSGPGGRILERDVIAARDQGNPSSAPLPVGDDAPHRRRALIARRMRESLSTTAQFTLHGSAEATVLRNLRNRLKEAHQTSGLPDVNLNELLMFAVVKALQAVPALNAVFRQEKLICLPDINLGFACDTPQGLVVPVIRKCQELTLLELAARIRKLAESARTDSLTPQDLQEGSFTVSNLGSYGMEAFTPIINLPQVAILGINQIQLRPIRAGDQIQFREYIGFSLTCDHQVVDGVLGAKFLNALKEAVERLDQQATDLAAAPR
jgi:pyruvate dehydrogenase E2 component (dihydrolipoamide acetyltransferase)